MVLPKKALNIIIFLSLILYILFSVVLSYTSAGYPIGGHENYTHYFYSLIFFKKPSLFVNLYARPIHLILSSPFSQLGIYFLEIYNLIVNLAASYFIYKSATKLNFKEPFFIGLSYLFLPYVFISNLTTLTEPTGSLLLSLSIFLYVSGNKKWASFVISWLPYIRPEYIIFLGLFFLLSLYLKNYQYLPYLLSGTLILFPLGALYYNDIFWLISKNPNLVETLTYPGKKDIFYYLINYMSFAGSLLSLMLVYSFFYIRLINDNKSIKGSLFILISIYALAHISFFSISQYLNLFGSSANLRYLLTLTPISSLLIGYSIDFLIKINSPVLFLLPYSLYFPLYISYISYQREHVIPISLTFLLSALAIIFIAYMKRYYWILYPVLFLSMVVMIKSTFILPKPLDEEDKTVKTASIWLKERNLQSRYFYLSNAFLIYDLDLNMNDEKMSFLRNYPDAKKGDILVWDAHFSREIDKVDLSVFFNKGYKKLIDFSSSVIAYPYKDNFKVVIYEKI